MSIRMLVVGLVVLALAGTVQAQMLREGVEVRQAFETPHPYGAAQTSEPTLAWSDTLHDPRATYISAHFSKFHLAPGDHVLVRSPDGEQVWRYEGLGRGGYGLDPRGFWSSRIRGDTALVELYTQSGGGAYGYSIDLFVRGFGQDEMDQANPFAICGGDDSEWAKCYETSEPQMYQRGKTLSRLHLPGGFVCTGWLVGCEGHLMTNNHCIANTFEATNTDYEFMAEGATCTTPCFSASACSGPTEATTATLIQTSGALDYTLVKLPGNLSSTYGYLAMREEGAELDERIYIPQHPAGWGKRFAVFSDHPTDASGFCEVFSLNSPPCTGGGGDIGYYCDTQGGSSGSPVLGYSDHRVVSLHHCANCPNRGLDITDVIDSLGSNLPSCALEQFSGTIELDRELYGCADSIVVTVVDDSIQGAGNQAVTVSSLLAADGETLVLDEQFPGVFRGSLPTTGAPAVGQDGELSLGHGDTATGVYIDADDGAGGQDVPRQDSASTDCQGPQISGVQVSGINGSQATVSWQTDEPADSLVQYGVAPPGSSSASDGALVDAHSLVLDNLVDCSPHVFQVVSADGFGNVATDDNSGAFYDFMAACFPPLPVPDGGGGTTPLRVERLAPDGSELAVHWDDVCSPTEVNLIYGSLADVSTYAVEGSRCAVSQPANWDAVPGGDLWFLLVGANGVKLESSWGHSSNGERKLLASSQQCGVLFKSPLASCP